MLYQDIEMNVVVTLYITIAVAMKDHIQIISLCM